MTRTFDEHVGAAGRRGRRASPRSRCRSRRWRAGWSSTSLRDRRVGVLLVRLGGCACGVFDGPTLVASKVTTRQVHGRIAAGGQSQQRFARRREGQVRVMLQASADTAVRVLLPEVGDARRASSWAASGRPSTRCWPTARLAPLRAARHRPAARRAGPAPEGARGVVRPAARGLDPRRRPASPALNRRSPAPGAGDLRSQLLGGSSLPASSSASACSLVLCTAPSAWSGGP